MPVRSPRADTGALPGCAVRGSPPGLLRRLEAVQDDPAAVRKVGIEHATLQCRELLEQQAAGLHFYTLNHSTATRAIWSAIRGQLGD